ncbi:MAG: hypothetical protein M3R36_13975 [Bacteroidota bacterium]|nr:hypothetical protein [Bacteroidota bacterium]
METDELKSMWKAHDNILDKSMKLNLLCIETIQSQRSKTTLKPLLALRVIEAFVLISIIFILNSFFYQYLSNIILIVPAVILIIFLMYNLYLCAAQIIIIVQINYSDSVTQIQEKLSLLQTHVLDYFRLSFLAVPFWFIYPVAGLTILSGESLFHGDTRSWWIAQIIISLISIPVSIYFYRQVSYKNIHKRWVRFLIVNAGGKSVTRAMEFLREINEFKKD